ncbi:hypothetical protein JOD97_004158 [Duganella sp. 1411]|uniref:Z1 domain-containing protein n=1 Tax=Duganella sp. 1411 TaxID=2806572 RepID=UPI001AE0F0CA|nr:hypothetical protein [Duganella sp. 1411]
MSDFLINPQYDPYRNHIDKMRRDGFDWNAVAAGGAAHDNLDSMFTMSVQFFQWPSLGDSPAIRRQVWQDIVYAKRQAEEMAESVSRPLVVVGAGETEPEIQVPTEMHSSWQLYKSHLLAQHWKDKAVASIETSSLKILRHLRKNTQGQPAVRGLVVGHVQSGKTASMAGLMAMAADHGWNMFIVLSGTLENLRKQTKKRLLGDLNHIGNLHWHAIEHPSAESAEGERAQDYHFSPGHRGRYFSVCLKNSSRLAGLAGWITANALSLEQMRILIIDDEADQGGINTAPISAQDRTRLNKLIVDLTNVTACSVNYVAYTATPAANFLNEGPGDGLYPEDFIVALPQSDEHFGPVQIFGLPEAEKEALGIVRPVSKVDQEAVAALHDDGSATVPDSLEEAVLWFLCCTAAMRYSGFAKPVTMLIHTSQRQGHHENMDTAVKSLLARLQTPFSRLRKKCEQVWERVKADLDLSAFGQRFPSYGRLDSVPDYPAFADFAEGLRELVSEVSSIRLDQDGTFTYGRGIHLCVDNCANNGVNDENEVRRLFYPATGEPDSPDFATAFIVIGGSTLARGLTLENLVSTYFFRASAQADSLMQMGRWFGYRKGYELLPRIWMPKGTREKFDFMTLAEEDLRDDLKRFMDFGCRPSEYGPRVRVHPRASWLRPTAASRMQAKTGAKYDFSGVNRQTTVFDDGLGAKTIHTANLAHTEGFLQKLGEERAEKGLHHSVVWRGVRYADIRTFLAGFLFHESAQFFSDLAPFLEWYAANQNKTGYGAWNVVVAGNAPDGERRWDLPGGAVGRVDRTRLAARSKKGVSVSVGVLRNPGDLLADSRADGQDSEKPTKGTIAKLRAEGGVGKVPQLLLYLIDRHSTPPLDRKDRAPLDAPAHIVGMSIWLPESGRESGQFATHLTVKIPAALADTSDGAAETPE